MPKNAPLVLMILDGWGYNENNQYNAIATAHTPHWDEWWKKYPHALLQASGIHVGLPEGQMGNSEVGHMHIGAGRIIQQDYTRINFAMLNDAFANAPSLSQTLDRLQETGKSLHIMGLLSPGGVHSHEQHLFALLAFCNKKQFHSVYLHVFLDGRDCPPQSALSSLERLNKVLAMHPVAKLASISGRYYAMDRDKRWERVSRVYDLLTQGLSDSHFDSAESALKHYYQQQITDEFVPPTLIGNTKIIEDHDAVLYFNFRADRARALSEAFVNNSFEGFVRKRRPQLIQFLTMTQYDKTLSSTVLFPPISLKNTLGEVIASKGLTQLRVAETEKYAHVTFFLNGGIEPAFLNEERILIPSSKVATYDLKPEMSAVEVSNTLIEAINQKSFDVIICNYANADMVGHSGNFKATVKAIECLDQCMYRVWNALAALKGILLITADHGNAEMMFNDENQQAHTAHTSKPVPFLCLSQEYQIIKKHGSLIDIAPTVLSLLGLPIPEEMTGHILMERKNEQS